MHALKFSHFTKGSAFSRPYYLAFHAGLAAIITVMALVNLNSGDWQLFGTDIFIVTVLSLSWYLVQAGKENASLRLVLVYGGFISTVSVIVAAHIGLDGAPISVYVLPQLMTMVTLAGLFAASRRHFYTVFTYVGAGFLVQTALVFFGGTFQGLDAIASTTYMAIAMGSGVALFESRRALTAQRDAAHETARSKGAFLSNMSHELRTPLSGIASMTRLLGREPSTEDARSYLSALSTSVNSLTSILEDILDLHEIEQDESDDRIVRFEPARMVENLRNLFLNSARARGISLSVEVQEDVPPFLKGDERRIRHILQHLIDNAIKFTSRGGVLVSVRGRHRTPNTAAVARVEFSVKDTGPGIPDALQGIVFEPFTQGNLSVSKQHQGTGLGLSISRALAQRLGGELFLETTPGAGSRFYFVLNLREAETSSGGHELPEAPYQAQPGTRILLAEDDRINVLATTNTLQRAGYTVRTVHDGQAAIDAIAASSYDLILMDVQMPVVDGLTAIREIRKQERISTIAETNRNPLPIICVTAYASAADRKRCIEAGADAVVVKPYTPEQLVEAVGRYIGGNVPELTSGTF